MSTKEREGKPAKTPSLEKSSLAVIACLKIEVACAPYIAIDIFVYKMNATLI
jgi:hypothetical protein